MKIAVIGAGIAGLTTARELVKRGASVKVFEKSRGLGGRLATKRLDWGHIDIGAQYFTARDPRFQQEFIQWQREGVIDHWHFTPHKISAAGLTTSPDKETRYVGTPRMNSFAHVLARNLDISLNTQIEGLERNQAGWRLLTKDDELSQAHYDWVVLTSPAEQSKTLSQGTAIHAQIPDSIHRPCWALALATTGSVPDSIQGIFGDDLVSWVSRLSSRPQRATPSDYEDLWMLHFAADWSEKHEHNSHSQLTQTGLEWLSQVLGKPLSQPLKTVHSHPHYWRYASIDENQPAPALAIDKGECIAALGAWTSGGRVEGAYLSALNFIDHFFDEN